MIFPISHIINYQSITLLMVLYGVSGKSEIAADIGLIQATSSILINALSSNARIVILSSQDINIAKIICAIRIILLLPIIGLIYLINQNPTWSISNLFYIVVVRKIAEWICEVDLSEKERNAQRSIVFKSLFIQILILILMAVSIIMNIGNNYLLVILWAWSISPFLNTFKFICVSLNKLKEIKFKHIKFVSPHFGSSIVIALSLFIFRWLIVYLTGKVVAGNYFTAFAIGGLLGSIFVNAYAPTIVFKEKNTKNPYMPSKLIKFSIHIYLSFGILIIFFNYIDIEFLKSSFMSKYFWLSLGFSMIGGVIMMHAQLLRSRLLILNRKHNLLIPDIIMNIIILLLIPVLYYIGGELFLTPIILISSCIVFGTYYYSQRF